MARELNKVQQKAQRKKITILVVMVLTAGATWSKNLFGKGDKPSPAPTPTAVGTAAAAPTAATAGSAPAASSSSISTYDQAVARMELWPVALDRQVHAGTIEELTPINDLLGSPEYIEEIEEEEPEQLIDLTPVLQPMLPPEAEDPTIAFEDLRLKLTTTARFGKSTYAVINGTRVKDGESVEIQVDGETIRYEVRAIGTREVEVAYAGGVHVLRIGLSGFDTPELEGA